MAIHLVTALVKHERRIRLLFDADLAVGAFTSFATLYAVTAVNGDAASPAIVAAFAVDASPEVVELHLSVDLVQGVLYEVTANGVPAVGGGSTPTPSSTRFRTGVERTTAALGTPQRASDLARRLYGVNIVHDGRDFLLAPNGDLASVAGPPVVKSALTRRIGGDTLPWEPPDPRRLSQYVDAPSPALADVPPLAVAAALQDDRVQSATAEVLLDDADGTSYIVLHPRLIGDQLVSGIGPIRAPIG